MSIRNAEIVTSAGRLGQEERSYDRLYLNWGQDPIEDSYQLTREFTNFRMESEQRGKSRVVFRGLIGDEVMRTMVEKKHPLLEYAEVAFPVVSPEVSEDRLWLIMLAKNGRDRQSIYPIAEMITATNAYDNVPSPANRRIKKLLDKGFTFTNQVTPGMISQLHALWGETFGWSHDAVEEFAAEIGSQQNKAPSERQTWFSGILSGDTLVTASTAELLDFPTRKGKLSVVESTEWRTHDEWSGKGLLTGALMFLHTQVIADREDPLLIAECNFMSRSDRAGFGAGFVVPQRDIAGREVPQILVQNVAVEDGHAPVGLRDFTFMYIPSHIREALYNRHAVDEVVQLTTKK